MPNSVRVDNYHGFPHIHFSLKGKHQPIKKEITIDEAFKIITDPITNNIKINKEKLKEELL